jgi:methyl-accepting chemotaxis protein
MSSLSIRRRLQLGFLILVLLVSALCTFNVWSSGRLAKANNSMSEALEAALVAEEKAAQISTWINLLDRTTAGQDAAMRQLAEAVINNHETAALYPDGSEQPLKQLLASPDIDPMLSFMHKDMQMLAEFRRLQTQLSDTNQQIIEIWRPRHGEMLHELNDLKRTFLYWNLKITNMLFVGSSIGELVYENIEETPIETFRQSPIYQNNYETFPQLKKAFEQLAEMNQTLYVATDRLDTMIFSGDWDKVRQFYRDNFPTLVKSIAVEIDTVLAVENQAESAQQQTMAILNGSLRDANRELFQTLTTLNKELRMALTGSAEIVVAKTAALQSKRIEAAELVNSAAFYNIALSLIVIILGIIGSVLITRSVVIPLNEVVEKMEDVARGEGDLTRTINVTAKHEMGVLANNFNQFVCRLREIIRRSRVMFADLREAVGNIDEAANKVRTGAKQQETYLKDAADGLSAVDQYCRTIATSTETVLEATRESSSATLEMNGIIEEIADQTDRLFALVEEVTSSNHEMAVSSREISGNISDFAKNMEQISGSIQTMDGRTARIEALAKQTHLQADQVVKHAREGRAAVATSITGVEKLNSVVLEASEAMTQLGAESEAIGQVLQVIDDISEQTHLLSLNARIIAAQAGSHGLAFGVVADEIRQLAERTVISTHEIAAIIDTVQKRTTKAVNAISAGRSKIEQEVTLVRAAGDRLAEIEKSSNRSSQQVEEIVHVAHEQSVESRQMTENIEQTIETIHQIATSIQQQTQGVQQAATASENMREIAFVLRRGTEEQTQGSRMISQGIEQILAMIEEIGQATQSQSDQSRMLVALFEKVRTIAEQNIESSANLEIILVQLVDNTTGLEQELGKFKIGSVNTDNLSLLPRSESSKIQPPNLTLSNVVNE